MKKNIINYYAIIILFLYLFCNIGLRFLKIEGIIYHIIMIVLIIINGIILIVFRRKIRYRKVICIIYFFAWLLSKNMLQCFFSISNIIVLIIICIKDSKFMKLFVLTLGILLYIYFLPLCFILFLKMMNEDDIYESTHYYCENNYEIYSYSLGAMDKYHYSIGKYYEFLDLGDIIHISYEERNEVSRKEYNSFLNSFKCELVGDKNESK